MRRPVALALAAAALLAALLGAPAAALAHATLEETRPARGAQLDRAPAQVLLRFDEPVNVALGGVEVVDSGGRAVQQGDPFHPSGHGEQVAVRLPGDLPDGGYTVTYRVVSADSHPVAGGFTFTIGTGGGAAPSVATLLEGRTAGRVTTTAFAVVRAVQFAAIALGLGAYAFLLACWLPGLAAAGREGSAWAQAALAFGRRTRALLAAAAVAGAVSAVLGILLEGAVGAGASLWDAVRADVVRDVLATRFGAVWGLAALAWLAVGAWAATRAPSVPSLRPPLAATASARYLLGVPLLALALLPALSGHPAVQSPAWLLTPSNVLHVLAVCAWLGGIAALVLAVRPAAAGLDAEDRLPLLAAVVSRFSALAGVAFAVLLATGVVQAVVEVHRVGALLDTAFGRAVLIKLVLFASLVAIGWANRAHVLPALRRGGRDAPALLRRTLASELVLGVAVLGVTGALAGYPPSTAAAPAGPVSREASVGPAHLELTVDPAAIGANVVHLYLIDHRTGAPFARAKEVRVSAELPGRIEPIPLDVSRAGPGHAIAHGSFGVAGDWRLTVTVRVSAFDEFVTRVDVPIKEPG